MAPFSRREGCLESASLGVLTPRPPLPAGAGWEMGEGGQGVRTPSGTGPTLETPPDKPISSPDELTGSPDKPISSSDKLIGSPDKVIRSADELTGPPDKVIR